MKLEMLQDEDFMKISQMQEREIFFLHWTDNCDFHGDSQL